MVQSHVHHVRRLKKANSGTWFATQLSCTQLVDETSLASEMLFRRDHFRLKNAVCLPDCFFWRIHPLLALTTGPN